MKKNFRNWTGSSREVVENADSRLLIFGDRFPFRYLAEEYGLDYYAAFSGCASDTEPSAATMAFLINKVKRRKSTDGSENEIEQR